MSIFDRDSVAVISLRVIGANLEEVTKRLGLKPTKVIPKGTERIGRGGRYSPQRQDLWLLEESAPAIDQVVAVLGRLVQRLTSRKEQLEAVQRDAQRVDIVVGLFLQDGAGGLELGGDLVALLGDLGLPVGIDIYCLSSSD